MPLTEILSPSLNNSRAAGKAASETLRGAAPVGEPILDPVLRQRAGSRTGPRPPGRRQRRVRSGRLCAPQQLRTRCAHPGAAPARCCGVIDHMDQKVPTRPRFGPDEAIARLACETARGGLSRRSYGRQESATGRSPVGFRISQVAPGSPRRLSRRSQSRRLRTPIETGRCPCLRRPGSGEPSDAAGLRALLSPDGPSVVDIYGRRLVGAEQARGEGSPRASSRDGGT